MFWYFILMAACVVVDQLTKILVTHTMTVGESIPVLPDLFSFTYITNDGAGLSILEGRQGFLLAFTVLALIMMIGILIWLPKEERRLRVALSVLIGGAVGNFIDRICFQKVVDFLDVDLFPFVFNLADCCVTCSVIVICVLLFFCRERYLLEDKPKVTAEAVLTADTEDAVAEVPDADELDADGFDYELDDDEADDEAFYEYELDDDEEDGSQMELYLSFTAAFDEAEFFDDAGDADEADAEENKDEEML